MRWLGIGLALGGVVVALIAAFSSVINVPLLIGAVIFAVIGMIVFIKGYRHQPR
jgi:hypothetical protein